ncbi:MAG: FAD:protein FMN transferase [Chthoniobacteraceae bacterium]
MELNAEPTSRVRLTDAPIRVCGQGYYEVTFFALGSPCQVFYGADSAERAEAFRQAAAKWLNNFEASCSRFLPDSEVSRINANAGVDWTATDPTIEMLLDLSANCHFVTEGAFDATSLPLTKLWDWRRKHDTLPTAAEIAAARELVGWNLVQREPGRVLLPKRGMLIDFGGVGKEFAVDCVKQLAVSMGLEQVMVNLGGDIAVGGDSPEGDGWYVGIEDPIDVSECYCGIRLKSGRAVATSGDYHRCFEHHGRTYGHILDCRTGWPVANGTRVVTVIARSCVAAGLLSTSAMIIGGVKAIAMLERAFEVEGCLWCDGAFFETRGFRRTILPREWQTP